MKILKESRKAININAKYFKKELKNIERNQEKLANSFAERKTELKAINSRMDNMKERINGLDDRILEITQLG